MVDGMNECLRLWLICGCCFFVCCCSREMINSQDNRSVSEDSSSSSNSSSIYCSVVCRLDRTAMEKGTVVFFMESNTVSSKYKKCNNIRDKIFRTPWRRFILVRRMDSKWHSRVPVWCKSPPAIHQMYVGVKKIKDIKIILFLGGHRSHHIHYR